MKTIEKIIEARKEIWDKQPDELTEILKRRDMNMPAGNIIYGEACTRECCEMIWNFEGGMRSGKISERTAKQFLPVFFKHFSVDMHPFYNLKICASLLDSMAEEVPSLTLDEILQTLDEFRVYLDRLNLWIDLYVPWQAANEELRKLNF